MEDLVESFSGVRGIYGKSITEKFAAKYASAYAEWLSKKAGKRPSVAVGMDTRKSGGRIKDAMIDALSEFCENIFDVSVATTPMIELAVREYGCNGGIIITASHNEPEFNGWKFLGSDGAILKPEEMEEVIKRSKSKSSKKSKKGNKADKIKEDKAAECRIANKELDIEEKYRKFIIGILGNERIEKIKNAKLKLVVDLNGSSAWSISGKILKDLDVESLMIAAEPGEFKRKIEPNESSLAYMGKIVKENSADFGVGFDCDADRAEFVAPFSEIYGKILSGHYLLAIMADYMLPNAEKSKRIVVVNDPTSQLVHEIVKMHKGKTFEVEVGEINVVSEMKKKGAILGGEGTSSGAIIPPSTSRDGILAMAMLLAIIAEKKENLSEIIAKFPCYHTIQTKVKTHEKSVKKKIRKYFDDCRITETGDESGGIKVWTGKNEWIWFRPSRTEPGIVRIISDSLSEEKSGELIILGKKALGIGANMC